MFFKNGQFTSRQDSHTGLPPGMAAATAKAKRQNSRNSPFTGTFITTGEVVDKTMVRPLLAIAARNPVVEMETAAVARVAHELKVPVAALRAISDGADENLDFSIEDFTDQAMRIRSERSS